MPRLAILAESFWKVLELAKLELFWDDCNYNSTGLLRKVDCVQSADWFLVFGNHDFGSFVETRRHSGTGVF